MSEDGPLFILVIHGDETGAVPVDHIRKKAKHRAADDTILHIGLPDCDSFIPISRNDALAWTGHEIQGAIKRGEGAISLAQAISIQKMNPTALPSFAQQAADRRLTEETKARALESERLSHYHQHIPAEISALITRQHVDVLMKKYRASHSIDEYGFDASDERAWISDVVDFVERMFKHTPSLTRFGRSIEPTVISSITQLVLSELSQNEDPGGSPMRTPIPKDVMDAVWRRDQGRCIQCNSQRNLEFDHIIAVSLGGANTYRNIQLLCQDCNRAKSAKPPGQ